MYQNPLYIPINCYKPNIKFKYFISDKQIQQIENSLIPNFLNNFNFQVREKFEIYFSKLIPKRTLPFPNSKMYMDKYNISRFDVAYNSIKFIFKDINEDDLQFLAKEFEIFLENNKVAIIQINQQPCPVCFAIIDSLIYIKSIQKILLIYNPLKSNNYQGTKNRGSSELNLIKTQLSNLKNRLNHDYFPITNRYEVEKTELQINFLNYVLNDSNYLSFWFNCANLFGLDNKLLELSELEIEAISQLLNFFNGIKTSYEELLKSVCIFLRIQSKVLPTNSDLHKQTADSIYNIVVFFLNDVIKKITFNKKNNFQFTHKDMTKEYAIKTILFKTFIYKNKSSNDTKNDFEFLFESIFDFILGKNNVFEKETIDDSKEITKFTILRNIAKFKQDTKLKKEDFKLLVFLLSHIK